MAAHLTMPLDMESHPIIHVPSPSAGTDAANKAYVDMVVQGLDVKASAIALASSPIGTLSGLATTIDGVLFNADGMRVQLTAESSAVNNGPWLVHSGAWTRPADFAAGSSAAGAFTFIEQGTVWADTGWVCTANSGSDVVGTNNLPWVQFSAAGVISVSGGLVKVGNVVSVANADGTLVVTTGDVRRAAITGDVGVPAGSNSATLATVATAGTTGDASHVAAVTIDVKGRVTAAASTAIAIDASAVTSGNLANARLPVATTGAVLFGRSGGGYNSDSAIVVDATNHRLGVNQATPTHTVHVGGDIASTGDVAVGNQLSVGDTGTFGGHLSANDGATVAGGDLIVDTGQSAHVAQDITAGGDLTVAGHGTTLATYMAVVNQPAAAPGGISYPGFLWPASADRSTVSRPWYFAGLGDSNKQSFQVTLDASQSVGTGETFTVTFTVQVNGVDTVITRSVNLVHAPGSSTPSVSGATFSLSIPDGSLIAIKEDGATTAGSTTQVNYIASIVLTLSR